MVAGFSRCLGGDVDPGDGLTGLGVGTPAYMAPEQGRGQQVDGRADQYALGVVGYQMVAGDVPFDSDDVFALMFKHMSEPPVPLATLRSDAPADLCRAIERALAKDPADRFASMEEFAAALDRPTPLAATAVIERPVAAKPARPAVTPPRSASRAAVFLGGAGLAVVVVALALTTNRSTAGLEPLVPPQPMVAPPSAAPAVVRPPETLPEPDSARTALAKPVVQTGPPPTKPAPVPPAPSPSPAAKIDRAMVTIGVDGSYATVYIDNEVVGETPVVRELSFGEHEIRIEREGFKTIRQRVVVVGPMTRRFTLEPAGTP